jgi:hypothetical protein
MRKILRARNVFLLLVVLPVVLIAGDLVLFAYRTNNICDPGDHIIQSESDAIETAKSRVLQARYGSYGYFDEKPGLVDFSQTDDCCGVTRTRNGYGVIVWEVSLRGVTTGETIKRRVDAFLALSNCGAVFVHDSFITAEPIKVDSIWPKIK